MATVAISNAVVWLSPFVRESARALSRAGAGLVGGAEPVNCTKLVSIGAHAPTAASTAWIAPTATVAGKVALADAASIWYSATVVSVAGGALSVGAGAAILDAATVSGGAFETKIGAGAWVGPNAKILGALSLGERCTIGAGASVLEGAVIGMGAVVGAGSVVPAGAVVGDAELWAGAPAVLVRSLAPAEIADADASAVRTRALALCHAGETAKSWETLRVEAEAYEDSQLRHPKHFQRLKESDYDHVSVLGAGIPGRIFNSNISKTGPTGTI